MRTNIVMDDQLVRRAMKLSGTRTKREVVHLALRRLVGEREAGQAQVLNLVGCGSLDPAYDVRAVRARMGHGSG